MGRMVFPTWIARACVALVAFHSERPAKERVIASEADGHGSTILTEVQRLVKLRQAGLSVWQDQHMNGTCNLTLAPAQVHKKTCVQILLLM